MERRLPDGWDSRGAALRARGDTVATRKASQDVIQWAAAQVPHLVSGSADLEPSTLTLIDDGGSVQKGDYAGRNVHYGVREHGMGAVVNGLNLHGLRAFGSTFFNFLDYMKGAMRLASLMQLPVILVFTHDSIGLGEDGPTHQPVEQLAHLRATPNVNVVRPADANETALAWRVRARAERRRPCALVLSRQGLPVLDPDASPTTRSTAAPTCCATPTNGGEPDLILIGTGSEVLDLPRRPPSCSRPTASPRAWSACPAWTASRGRTRTTATRCCRPPAARGCRWRRRPRSAGSAG